MLQSLKSDCSVRVYSLASKYGDCSIRVYQVLHNKTLHIMLALCLMLLAIKIKIMLA